MKLRIWVLSEAFVMTGDAFGHQTVHKTLYTWGMPFANRREAVSTLRDVVEQRVRENYEGLDDSEESVRSDVKSDVKSVLDGMKKLGNMESYSYSAEDREVVWKLIRWEVEK